MKYLYLIIRHFFPRRRWETMTTVDIWKEEYGTKSRFPSVMIIVQRDQFGNLRKFSIKH